MRFVKRTNVYFNPLSANPTKWPNTLKQFVGKLPTNCLSVFGHFVNLALKGLNNSAVFKIEISNLIYTKSRNCTPLPFL